MIDKYLYNDIYDKVEKICKLIYKKHIFDFSGLYKIKAKELIQSKTYKEINDWIKNNS